MGVTLGRDGALVFTEGRFHHSPASISTLLTPRVPAMYTTGGFIYALVRGWGLKDGLEFANAMAALNSMALGARGGIATEQKARKLMARGSRNVNPDYAARGAL